jgi:hypothetical protein
MTGLLDFAARFGTEERCIEHLARLRWPGGFVCSGCSGGGLAAEGSTAGLRVRHVPPAGVGDGGNSVSSDADGSDEVVSCRLFDGPRQARRLGQISAAGTGGGVPDGLDHGAQVAPRAERRSHRLLRGFLEADETFIGGRGDPTSSGRSTANPDKSLLVAAVEKVPAPKNTKGKYGHAVKRQHGFFAGNARIAVLPAATGVELGAFLKANIAAQSHLLTDGFAGYRGGDAGLGEHLKHTPVVQGEAANPGEFFRIIHTLFSNIKAWLVGTHHGVSAKHLPRYLREWFYRFNPRNLPDGWTATSFGAPSNAPPSPTIN